MILRVLMRKDENKAFSIDVNAYFINPTTHTISISRSEDAKGIDIKKEERAEAVFKLPSTNYKPAIHSMKSPSLCIRT